MIVDSLSTHDMKMSSVDVLVFWYLELMLTENAGRAYQYGFVFLLWYQLLVVSFMKPIHIISCWRSAVHVVIEMLHNRDSSFGFTQVAPDAEGRPCFWSVQDNGYTQRSSNTPLIQSRTRGTRGAGRFLACKNVDYSSIWPRRIVMKRKPPSNWVKVAFSDVSLTAWCLSEDVLPGKSGEEVKRDRKLRGRSFCVRGARKRMRRRRRSGRAGTERDCSSPEPDSCRVSHAVPSSLRWPTAGQTERLRGREHVTNWPQTCQRAGSFIQLYLTLIDFCVNGPLYFFFTSNTPV